MSEFENIAILMFSAFLGIALGMPRSVASVMPPPLHPVKDASLQDADKEEYIVLPSEASRRDAGIKPVETDFESVPCREPVISPGL